MQLREALRLAATRFHDANIPSANLDARLLLAKVLNCSSEYLISRFDQELTDKQQDAFEQLIKRRLRFEPIAYILGFKEFYSREFKVDKRVLIPRGDTEILVDMVINYSKLLPSSNLKILDLGVGSGAIAITLALEIMNSHITASDISLDTLKLAKENAKNLNIDRNINFIHSDWYKNIPDEKFNIIVSNPPYISNGEKHLMAKETLEFEPYEALFAEEKGLIHYNTIINEAKNFLLPQGRLFLEVGLGQAESVAEILKQNHFIICRIVKDLRGISRALEAKIV